MGQPFAFGKLPAHGDFVSRGLDPVARNAWDGWASAALAQADAALGLQFDPLYASAPPWRFVFGPGAFGPGWRAGALAASVDRAGRRFPLVAGLAWPGEPDRDPEPFAAAAEAALYAAIAEALTIEVLIDRLGAIAPSQAAPRPEPLLARFWTAGGEHHAPASLAREAPGDDLLRLVLTPAGAVA